MKNMKIVAYECVRERGIINGPLVNKINLFRAYCINQCVACSTENHLECDAAAIMTLNGGLHFSAMNN
jgi:hypothetical protein